MAVPRVGQIVATTLKALTPTLADNIHVGTRTLKVLMTKPDFRREMRGGEHIELPIAWKRNTNSKWQGWSDNYSIAAQDQFDSATFEWRLITSTVQITKEMEVKNKGRAKVLDLVKLLKDKMLEDMGMDMNAALFNSGSDANAPAGTGAIILTTGTYGGIARSGNTWWQGVVDSTAEVLTVTDMDAVWNSASANRTAPNWLVTTRTLLQ